MNFNFLYIFSGVYLIFTLLLIAHGGFASAASNQNLSFPKENATKQLFEEQISSLIEQVNRGLFKIVFSKLKGPMTRFKRSFHNGPPPGNSGKTTRRSLFEAFTYTDGGYPNKRKYKAPTVNGTFVRRRTVKRLFRKKRSGATKIIGEIHETPEMFNIFKTEGKIPKNIRGSKKETVKVGMESPQYVDNEEAVDSMDYVETLPQVEILEERAEAEKEEEEDEPSTKKTYSIPPIIAVDEYPNPFD